MCGIIGYLGFRPAGQVLYSGLKALEYRGYDSAGIALIEPGATTLKVLKAVGKVDDLNSQLHFSELKGAMGMGHVRWATHGGVTKEKAHPHCSCDGSLAVAHNGIIEKYDSLREDL